MKTNQKGFSLVEGLLIIIALSLLGGVGYYVYNAQQTTNQANKTANAPASQPASQATPAPVTNKNPGFVTIAEWGVAVRIGDAANADKLTYKIQKDDYGDAAYFILSPSISKNCISAGFAVHRTTTEINGKYQKIGDGYYAPSAAPAPGCEKSTEEEKAKTVLTEISNSIDKMGYEVKASN